jgi:hypothetical protein
MTNFDDHLWSHLQAEHGADRVSARRPGEAATSRRPLILRGTAGLAAAIAAAVLALIATSATTPAFAVTRHHDGLVTVKVNRESGIAGANRELATMGIRAQVRAAGRDQSFPVSWDCTVLPGSKVDLSAMRADAAQDAAQGNQSAANALRTGANAIANGTEPDVVYNCTASGSSNTGNADNTSAG